MQLRPIRRSLLCWIPAAVLLLASAVPARADDADGDAQSSRFKAGLVISEFLAPGNLNCNAIGIITGTGVASHLGRVTLTSYDCIIFSGPPPGPFSFQTLQGTKAVLTAANGDQLFATYSGTATPQAGGSLALAGTYSFTGGTGRFARATGTGTLSGVEDISTMPANGVLLLTGRLSY